MSEEGEMKKTRPKLLEMKNKVLEMKNILTGINTRLGTKLKTGLSRMKQKQKSQGKGNKQHQRSVG